MKQAPKTKRKQCKCGVWFTARRHSGGGYQEYHSFKCSNSKAGYNNVW